MAEGSSNPDEIRALLCPPDPRYILKPDLGYIHCLNYSLFDRNNCIFLYAGTEKGDISIWNLTTMKQYLRVNIGFPVLNILLHDGKIITQDKQGTLRTHILEGEGLTLTSTMNTNIKGFVKCIIIDQYLVVPNEEQLDLYDIKTMNVSKNLVYLKAAKFGMIMCLTEARTSFGTYVLIGYESGDSVLWNTDTGRRIGSIKFNPGPTSMTFEPKSSKGVVVGVSDQIQVFELRWPIHTCFNIIYELEGPSSNSVHLTSVKSRPDGLVFVVGDSIGQLRYFSWHSMKLLVLLAEHNEAISDLQFAPNKDDRNKTDMIASSADGNISFWNIY